MKTLLIVALTLIVAAVVATTVFAVAFKLAVWVMAALAIVVMYYSIKGIFKKEKARNRRPF